jgi:thymidine kinase
MAKLYFYYSAMNAGKTTTLLQSSHNYAERGMSTLLLKPQTDDREETTSITSRIGLAANATCFAGTENLYFLIEKLHQGQQLNCVLVDEGQFLSSEQVHQLSDVVDVLGIPVLVYGIRTDFQGELFEGSHRLLALADELREIKTICHCGRKATMVIRLGPNGKPVQTGAQIQVGGNEAYISLCRKHWKAMINDGTHQ